MADLSLRLYAIPNIGSTCFISSAIQLLNCMDRSLLADISRFINPTNNTPVLDRNQLKGLMSLANKVVPKKDTPFVIGKPDDVALFLSAVICSVPSLRSAVEWKLHKDPIWNCNPLEKDLVVYIHLAPTIQDGLDKVQSKHQVLHTSRYLFVCRQPGNGRPCKTRTAPNNDVLFDGKVYTLKGMALLSPGANTAHFMALVRRENDWFIASDSVVVKLPHPAVNLHTLQQLVDYQGVLFLYETQGQTELSNLSSVSFVDELVSPLDSKGDTIPCYSVLPPAVFNAETTLNAKLLAKVTELYLQPIPDSESTPPESEDPETDPFDNDGWFENDSDDVVCFESQATGNEEQSQSAKIPEKKKQQSKEKKTSDSDEYRGKKKTTKLNKLLANAPPFPLQQEPDSPSRFTRYDGHILHSHKEDDPFIKIQIQGIDTNLRGYLAVRQEGVPDNISEQIYYNPSVQEVLLRVYAEVFKQAPFKHNDQGCENESAVFLELASRMLDHPVEQDTDEQDVIRRFADALIRVLDKICAGKKWISEDAFRRLYIEELGGVDPGFLYDDDSAEKDKDEFDATFFTPSVYDYQRRYSILNERNVIDELVGQMASYSEMFVGRQSFHPKTKSSATPSQKSQQTDGDPEADDLKKRKPIIRPGIQKVIDDIHQRILSSWNAFREKNPNGSRSQFIHQYLAFNPSTLDTVKESTLRSYLSDQEVQCSTQWDPKPKGGSKTPKAKLTPQALAALACTIIDCPDWTLAERKEYLKEKSLIDEKVSISTIYNYVTRLRFVYKSISYAPPARNTFGLRVLRVVWARQIKNLIANNYQIAFIDEAAVYVMTKRSQGWGHVGVCPVQHAPLNSRIKASILACVFPGFGVIYRWFPNAVKGDDYARFLADVVFVFRRLIGRPSSRFAIIHDNARIHTTAAVEAMTQTHKIHVVPTVPYSPQLNTPVESYFGICKAYLPKCKPPKWNRENLFASWDNITEQHFTPAVSARLYSHWLLILDNAEEGMRLDSNHHSLDQEDNDGTVLEELRSTKSFRKQS